MHYSSLAARYAAALFSLAVDNKSQERVLADLRQFNALIEKEKDVKSYLASPTVRSLEKEKVVKAAVTGQGLSQEVENFVLLLAQKGRLNIFSEVVNAYQAKSDAANGVTRGLVRSATVLSPEERSTLEKNVSHATGKRVILTYQEDPGVVGGLIAQVGSYTFDDSIVSHLRRLHEDLKRRAQ